MYHIYNNFVSFLHVIWKAVSRWMDGSLFFRVLTAAMDFVKRVCLGSYIASWFVGDNEHHKETIEQSFFAYIIDKMLNGFNKPIFLPEHGPKKLANFASGSLFVNTIAEKLDTPVPTLNHGGLKSVFVWGMYALPVWVLALVTFSAPLLPTMLLAGLLLPVFLFAFLSRNFVVDHMTMFLLLFIVLNLIVGVMSLARGSSIPIALLSSLFIAVVLAIGACCQSKNNVDFFFFIFLLGGAVTGIVGGYQWFVGYGSGIWLDQELFAGERRIFSTFGNPNVYGTYLLLAIPLAAACIVYVKNLLLKLCAVGVAGLLVINLLLTLSRGCYLSLALAAGIFVLIIEKRLIVAFIPALLALPFVLPQAIVNRLLSIVNFADTSTAFRLSIWQGSLRILQDFWMIGLGQGIDAYNRVYPYYAFAAIVSPHSHNLFIQIFVEMGIVGLIVFIGVLACFFRIMANFLRRTTDFGQRVMAAAMIAAVIGFLFQGIFDHVFYNYRVMLIFYIFIGLSMAFAKVHGADIGKEKDSIVKGYHD